MAIIPRFNMGDFERMFQHAESQAEEQFIRILKWVGEKAVNEAKENGNYQDHTANLRNSIGYVVSVDGQVVDENFNASKHGTEPSNKDPLKYGRTLAVEVAQSKRGISLVVVAGMRYASYVESKGRVVLTSAEQFASQYLPNLLKQLK